MSLSFYALPAADKSELLSSDAVRASTSFINNHTCSLQTIELSLRTAGSWMHPSMFRDLEFDFGPFRKGLYYAPHLNTPVSRSVYITHLQLVFRPFLAFSKFMRTLHTLSISAIDFHGDSFDHLLQEALVPFPYLNNLTINFELSERPISSGAVNE